MEFIRAEKEITVEFFDVDSMQVAWHGNYVKYIEVGRCALLDKIGYGYQVMMDEKVAFPVTGIKIKYVRPLRFGQKAVVRSALVEYENYLKIKYEIYDMEGTLCTKAESSQMAVDMATGETLYVCPPHLIERVRAAIKAEAQSRQEK